MPRRFARRFIPGLAALALLAAQPFALSAQTTIGAMTDAEREAFRREVRAYLLDNPEVIFEAVAEFERRNAEAQTGMDATLVELNAEAIFADDYSYQGFAIDGDLTLVEFIDYRCTYCRRSHPETRAFLAEDGRTRLVVKEFPILGPASTAMSRFAISVLHLAGPEAYAQAGDALFAWEGDFTEASVRVLAADLGLDGEAVLAHMPTPEVSAAIEATAALAQRLQITGTPTFVLGDGTQGQMLRGYVPGAEMARLAAEARG